jgi:hypothetical protein
MSEVVEDVVKVQVSHGQAEAQRMGRTDSGLSRWQIRYPWGVETFFGNSADLVVHAKRRMAEKAATAPRN